METTDELNARFDKVYPSHPVSDIDYGYDLAVLLNDNPLAEMLTGGSKVQQRLKMVCDARIPSGSIGYVTQLCSDSAIRKVQLDAARQLSKYVKFTIDPHRVED